MKNGARFIFFVICCLAIAPIELFVVYLAIGIEGVSFFKLMGSLFIFSFIARVIYEFGFRKLLSDVYDKEDVSCYITILCSISYFVGYIILGKIIQDIGWFRAIIQAFLFVIPNVPGFYPLYTDGGIVPDKPKSSKNTDTTSKKSSKIESIDDLMSKTKSTFKQPNGDTVYQDASGMTIGTSSSNPDGSTSYYNRDMKFIGTSNNTNGVERYYDSNLSYKGQSEKDAHGDTAFYDKDLNFKGKSSKNSNGTNSFYK